MNRVIGVAMATMLTMGALGWPVSGMPIGPEMTGSLPILPVLQSSASQNNADGEISPKKQITAQPSEFEEEPVRPTTTPTPLPPPAPTPTPEPPETLLADETVTLPDDGSAQTALFFSQRFQIQRPPGELIRTLQTRVWRARPVSENTPGLAFKAEVIARDGVGNELHQFSHPLTLTLNTTGLYNPLEHAEYIQAWAGYSNTITGSWDSITLTAITTNSITAITDHLSVFGFGTTGIVDGGWTPSWRDGQVDNFSGGFSWGYDFALPSGPGGISPRPLRLTYGSRSVDGILSWAQGDGAGLGWHLDPPEIAYRNVSRCFVGSGVYVNCHDTIYLLVIDGATYKLIETSPGSGEYRTQDDQFYKIQNHYGFWEVWLKDGTRLVFGVGDSSVRVPFGYNPSYLDTARWRLKWIDYPWYPGNQDVTYNYTQETYGNQCSDWIAAGQIPSGQSCWGGYDGSAVRASYLSSIVWPGARVTFGWRSRWDAGFGPFDPENGLGGQAWRSDFGDSQWAIFWQNKAIEKVYLDAQKPDGTYLNLRRWELGYGTINPLDNTSKTLRVLTSIQEYAPNNTVLPKTTFGYTQYQNKQYKNVCPNECSEWHRSQFYYPRLTQIANGYGATTTLIYTTPDTGDAQLAINYRLSSQVVNDGMGGGSDTVYRYSDWQRCYLGHQDAQSCTMNAAGGNFLGYRDMQIVQRDLGGAQELRRTLYSFYLPDSQPYDAYALRGKTRLTQVINGQTNEIYKTITTTWGYTPTIGADANFVFLRQTDTDMDAVQTRAENRYDCDTISPCYGNLERSIEYGVTNTAGDERTTLFDYFPNAGAAWLVGLPARQKTYAGAFTGTPAAGSLAAQIQNIYDYTNGVGISPTQGLITRIERGISAPFITEQYGYDAWGNKTVITDASGYVSTRSFDSSLHLYPVSETNAQNQTTQYLYYGINGSASQTGDGLTGQLEKVIDPNGAAVSAKYNWHGRVSMVIKPSDSASAPTVAYSYGDTGQTSVTPPLRIDTQQLAQSGCAGCARTTYQFLDGIGRARQTRVQSEDSGGAKQTVSSAQYDALGRTQATTAPIFEAVSGSYSGPAWNTITRTQTAYDVLDRTKVITGADDMSVRYLFGTSAGKFRRRAVDANLHTRVEASDGLGRMTAVEEYTGIYTVTQSLYATTQYSYNVLDNLIRVTDGLSNTTVITYDALGRKIGMKDPDMGVWSYVYDTNGNLISQTDANLNTLTFEYDKLNRLTGKYSGATQIAGFAYDIARTGQNNIGQRGAMWNAEDATTFDYDARGRLGANGKSIGQNTTVYEAESPPYAHGCGAASGGAFYSPAATGGNGCHISIGPYQPPAATGPRQTAIFRLAIDVADGQQDIVAAVDVYDSSSNQVISTRNLKRGEFKGGVGNFSEFALDFDTSGRAGHALEYRVLWLNRAYMAHDKTIVVWSNQPYQTDYAYDSADRVVTMTYPQTQGGREVVTTTYNSAMQPLTLNGAYGYVTGASYNALGSPIKISYVNGLNTQYRYWGLDQIGTPANQSYGRLRSICVSNLTACGDGETNALMNLAYGYDNVGNVTNLGDRARSERMRYTYDELGRLTLWEQQIPYGGAYVVQEAYAYDKIGNMMSKGGASYAYQDGKPHAVTHINGLRVASYDPNGNMTARTESATYAQKFDVENRLTDVNGVHFVYDADGNMVKKVEGGKTTTYIGNYFEKELVAVFVPSTMRSYGSQWRFDNTALPGGKTRKYYTFGGQRVAVRENDAGPQWIHGDHLGSVSLTTDSAGAKVGEERYKPFGGSRVDTGDVKGNKRFQGSERVASIELDSMGARFYSTGFGRFISADTIVPGAGNPQALNRYAFVLNNPLKMTDPSGHCAIGNDDDKCSPGDNKPKLPPPELKGDHIVTNYHQISIDPSHASTLYATPVLKQVTDCYKSGQNECSVGVRLTQDAKFRIFPPGCIKQCVFLSNYSLKKGFSANQIAGISLAIYMDAQYRFEKAQHWIDWPANSTSFHPEDLPSDYVGFFSALTGKSLDKIIQTYFGGQTGDWTDTGSFIQGFLYKNYSYQNMRPTIFDSVSFPDAMVITPIYGSWSYKSSTPYFPFCGTNC